jgi:hypothetical protein
MHFNDFLGNGKTETGSAFFLGTGPVSLVELLEDHTLIGFRKPGARIKHGD